MSRRRSGGGVLARLFLAIALLVLLGGGAVAWLIFAPYQGFSNERFVDIDKGTSSSAIARELSAAGVVRSPTAFLLVRALRSDARLQAGEYRFAQADSTWDVFERLVRGDVFY